jgi:hypothetical protein
MSPSTPVSRFSSAAAAAHAPGLRPSADGLQREAQAQLALNELFPHLRVASDAALRDIFVSLRVPARAQAGA